MNFEKTAEEILSLVGGKENIKNAIHCQSRLRLSLYDYKLINDAKVRRVEGVIGTKDSADVYQIVIGDKVTSVFEALMNKVGFIKQKVGQDADVSTEKKKGSLINTLSETVAAIFTPVGVALIGCGLVTALRIVLQNIGLISDGDAINTMLSGIGDAAFYFLPFYIALCSADRFKCNRVVALVLSGVLMYPTWSTLAAEGMESLMLFGVVPLKLLSYSSAIIPPILTVYILSKVERTLKKLMPSILGSFFIPFLEILILGSAALIIVGPLSQMLSDKVAYAVNLVFDVASIPASALFAGLYPIMVMTATHVSIFPLVFDNLAKYGVDYLLPLMGVAHTAMAAASLLVYFRTKNGKLKGAAASGALVTGIGLAEPALYGVCLPLKKPLVIACVSAGIGGAFFGIFRVTVMGIGYVPLGTFLLYFTDTFVYFVIGTIITTALAMVGTLFFGYKNGDEKGIPAFAEDVE
jgi:PTS system beta-glucosides-specific IIC component